MKEIDYMKELTENQIQRQDYVDGEIYQLIQTLNPVGKNVDWNICTQANGVRS